MSSSSENDELTFSLSPSSSSSFSFREEEETKKNFASPTTTLTPEEEEEEEEEEKETMEARVKRLEFLMLESQKENRSLRMRVEQLEKEEKSDDERTTKEQKDLLELFSTRLANVKETLREETKRAMDAAVGANAKVVKLLETLEACETEDGVVLYHRDVSGTGGGGGERIDHKSRGEEEEEDERKKKRNEYVKEALDQIAEEVGYEDAMVLAARGGGSGTGFASKVSSKRNGKYYRWVKILFAILTKALQLWVCMWILIVAAVLADDMTLRENVSGDFWAKFPWVSKGLVTNNFVGLASL
jgi:hypothetical protein